MILLAVGTQLPFDRLVRAVDEWALANDRTDVVGQIGPTTYQPRAMKGFPFMNPDQFKDLQRSASFFIAHAGMGSILTALELGKPILVMPRDHRLGEHRNGHQLATAQRFEHVSGVTVAYDESALIAGLERLDALPAAGATRPKAPDAFLTRLRAFVEDGRAPALAQGGGY